MFKFWSLVRIPLQLDREGIKEREVKMAIGVGGGGRLFSIFPSKGGYYSRETINRGNTVSGALIEREVAMSGAPSDSGLSVI